MTVVTPLALAQTCPGSTTTDTIAEVGADVCTAIAIKPAAALALTCRCDCARTSSANACINLGATDPSGGATFTYTASLLPGYCYLQATDARTGGSAAITLSQLPQARHLVFADSTVDAAPGGVNHDVTVKVTSAAGVPAAYESLLFSHLNSCSAFPVLAGTDANGLWTLQYLSSSTSLLHPITVSDITSGGAVDGTCQ